MEPTKIPEKGGINYYRLWYVLHATKLLQLVVMQTDMMPTLLFTSSIRAVERQKLKGCILKWCNAKILHSCLNQLE